MKLNIILGFIIVLMSFYMAGYTVAASAAKAVRKSYFSLRGSMSAAS